MIPSEFLRERLRGTLRAGMSDKAFDHSETKRLERCGLPMDELKSSRPLFTYVLGSPETKM